MTHLNNTCLEWHMYPFKCQCWEFFVLKQKKGPLSGKQKLQSDSWALLKESQEPATAQLSLIESRVAMNKFFLFKKNLLGYSWFTMLC